VSVKEFYEKVDVYESVAYYLRGVIYLPHYTIRNRYVSPGYGFHNEKLYTEKELKVAGAEKQILMLWNRSW